MRQHRDGQVPDRRLGLTATRLLDQLERAVRAAKQRSLPGIIVRLEAILANAKQRRGGRPQANVDLTKVEEIASKGIREISTLARLVGLSRDVLVGPAHRTEVLEAVERGHARWVLDAHEQYERALKGGKLDKAVFALLIFKLKQCGWTDRKQVSTGQPTTDVDGARERLLALVERYKAAHS